MKPDIKRVYTSRTSVMGLMFMMFFALSSCEKEELEFQQGDICLSIVPGPAYLHHFPLFLGMGVSNPPQFVVWTEDEHAQFLETLWCTKRSAGGNWRSAPSDPDKKNGIFRESALPYWSHKRGISTDGLHYMPDKSNPLSDAVTGATPAKGGDFKLRATKASKIIFVYFEVNHSTDWNEFFTVDARSGDENYSGGKYGSGQPSLVYRCAVHTDKIRNEYTFELIGHGSPDGNNGELYTNLENITTAKNIVESVRLKVF